MNIKTAKDTDQFDLIVLSFIEGMSRLFETEIVYHTVMMVTGPCKLRNISEAGKDGHPCKEIITALKKLNIGCLDSYEYVTMVNFMIYATTLFDSFLTDTTKYLFLKNPKSIGKDKSVSWDDIISAKSKATIVNRIVNKIAREQSYSSFSDRMDFINKQFGLGVRPEKEEMNSLKHFSGIRNDLVHDQSLYDIRLSPRGKIIVERKSNSRRPTHVSIKEVNRAWRSYIAITRKLYESINSKVLKRKEAPRLVAVLEGFEKAKLSPGAEGHCVCNDQCDYKGSCT